MLEDEVDQSYRGMCRFEYSPILPRSVAQVQFCTAKYVPILTEREILVCNDAGAGSVVTRDVVVDVQSGDSTDANNTQTRRLKATVCIHRAVASYADCEVSKTSHAS